VTQLEKLLKRIVENPKDVKAKEFVKFLNQCGFIMRAGDLKKTHRHYYNPEKPEQLIVVLFRDGESSILSETYIKRYLKELGYK